MIARLYAAGLGLAFVTAGMAMLFYGILGGWPTSPLEWCLSILFIAWGAVIASAGFEFLATLGDPQ